MSHIGRTRYADAAASRVRVARGRAGGRRVVLVAVTVVAALAGALATSADDTAQAVGWAGADLARLLRAMAGMKAAAAVGLEAAVLWRLALPVSRVRLGFYALGCAAMAAGPGLIWGMAHVRLGALLLHAGLLATVVMLWRDPAMGMRLGAVIERRRRALRSSELGIYFTAGRPERKVRLG